MPDIELFARTEIGCARERNEDAFLVLDLATGEVGLQADRRVRTMQPPGTVLAVCDGMGGAAAGDVASRLAIEELQRVMLARVPFADVEDIEFALLEAMDAANRAIVEHAQRHPEHRGMGTTMTAAVLFGTQIVVVHVGDSRAYLRRGNRLEQLTRDQSVVGQLLASGQLTREQARTFNQRNVLLQALGVVDPIHPELVVADICLGDQLLLCTDGLNGPLEDEAVVELMRKHEDPTTCCRALTEAACLAGGPDNVTVALARFVGQGLPVGTDQTPVVVHRRGPL